MLTRLAQSSSGAGMVWSTKPDTNTRYTWVNKNWEVRYISFSLDSLKRQSTLVKNRAALFSFIDLLDSLLAAFIFIVLFFELKFTVKFNPQIWFIQIWGRPDPKNSRSTRLDPSHEDLGLGMGIRFMVWVISIRAESVPTLLPGLCPGHRVGSICRV